jgi:hypothetical protein
MAEEEQIQPTMNQEHRRAQQPYAEGQPDIAPVGQSQQDIETPQSVKGGDTRQPDQKNAQDAKLNRYERWSLLVNMLLVLVTAVYAYFALGQWNTLESTLKITSEQTTLTRQALRARIAMIRIERPSAIGPNVRMPFNFFHKNTGGSTALRVEPYGRWGVYEGNPETGCLNLRPFPSDDSSTPLSVGTIGAGEQGFFTITLPPQSAQDMQDLTQGKKIIYFYGKVQYRDIFGTQHTTEFCNFFSINFGTFPFCPTHNHAD